MTPIHTSPHETQKGFTMGTRTAPKMKEYLTLADIRDRCAELHPDWSKSRQADLRSAIKKFAEAAGRPVAAIHADPKIIRALIAKASPQLAGIKKARWSNIRSVIDACLADLDVLTIRARQRCALSEGWAANIDLAETLKTKAHLSKFARWCSREGIEADAVDEDVFNTFEAELQDFSLTKNPGGAAMEARRAWNDAVSNIPDWVGVSVPTRCRRKQVTLPWETFPESFREDVDNYAEARSTPSEANGYDWTALRPRTIQGHKDNLRRFASMLVSDGLAVESITSIAALLTSNNVRWGIHDLCWGNEKVASPMACQYAHDFVSIARYRGFDNETLSQLIKFSRKTRRPQTGLTKQNRLRLQAFDDPEALMAMYMLPSRIADRLSGKNDISYADATEMRMAVSVEILLMAPMRRMNLAKLDIERNINWPKSVDGELRITFEQPEVKNSVALDFLLPVESSQMIRTYVDRFRPALLSEPSAALFPGNVEGHMAPNSLSRMIRLGLQRELGVDFNAHLFRHFACQNHLREHPGDYETLRRLCGHKKLETLVSFYAGTETEAAIKRYQETVLKGRKSNDDDWV